MAKIIDINSIMKEITEHDPEMVKRSAYLWTEYTEQQICDVLYYMGAYMECNFELCNLENNINPGDSKLVQKYKEKFMEIAYSDIVAQWSSVLESGKKPSFRDIANKAFDKIENDYIKLFSK